MSGRVAAVRNRVLVAAGAAFLAWLFDPDSTAGLVMILVVVVALVLAVMRGAFGGIAVLGHWLLRYRSTGVGLRQLGDIIGEHTDDMRRAGLVVSPGMRHRSLWSVLRNQRYRPRPRPDLVPRLRHRPDGDVIVVSLEAVRAGMSQDEILAALPRLRSAWGVDDVEASARPGGRVVDFRIYLDGAATVRAEAVAEDGDGGERDEAEPGVRDRARSTGGARTDATHDGPWRPPDAPPVVVVGRHEGPHTEAIAVERPVEREAPPSIEPARPRGPKTDEIPVIEAPVSIPIRQRPAPKPPAARPRRAPEMNGGGRANPTDVDEKSLRIGAQWRTGKER